jgi:uncharacterized UBP type Zn finger protein
MRDGPAALEEGLRALEVIIDAAAATRGGWSLLAPKYLRRPGDYAGLRNAGATCYMNSVFQQLFMQPRIRALILGAPEVPPDEAADSVFAQLQATFAALAVGLEPAATPAGFWAAFKDYDGQPIDTREHQDAYEFFTRLQVCVDDSCPQQALTFAFPAVGGAKDRS